MKNKKILFISLGCDKNLVDSEVMLGILADHGFEMTDTEDDADIKPLLFFAPIILLYSFFDATNKNSILCI